MAHLPVLLGEVVDALAPQGGQVHLDGTFGGGGYARAILEKADCRLLAVDRDLDAIARAEGMAAREPRLIPLLGRFGELDRLAAEAGYEELDGIVLDLGVSSFQLDEAARGFSFMREGPLDMRMGESGPSARDAVNGLSEAALANVIFRLGDEKQSRRIARAIVARRLEAPFETTAQLADTVEQALGGRRGARTHPATRTFQAIRMYINDEMGELALALAASERALKAGGRLVVVTFHSLEDRLVKLFLRERAGGGGSGSRHLPGRSVGPQPTFTIPLRKAVEPSETEIANNPRARSARLRLAVRTDAPAWARPVEAGFDLPPLETLEMPR